jgi:hypothetical protein
VEETRFQSLLFQIRLVPLQHDKSSFFYIVFQALTPTQQMMLGRSLGYANFITYKVPQGRYQLRMHIFDEYAVAQRLAKMAISGGKSANWENLHIDGRGLPRGLQPSTCLSLISAVLISLLPLKRPR